MAQNPKYSNPKHLKGQAVPAVVTDDPILPRQKGNALPLSKGTLEDIIGETRYDAQSNAAVQNRLVVWPDGSISAAWTKGQLESGYTDRGTGYNYYDGAAWGDPPAVRIETVRTGWPTMDKCNGNGEIVVAHTSVTAPNNKLVMNKRPVKGTGAWTQSTIANPPGATSLFWPRVMTSGPTNNYVHMLALTAPTGNGGVVYKGMDGALVYYRSLDGGATWDKSGITLPGMDSTFHDGFSADTYSWGTPHGDTIYFGVGGHWSDTFIMKSTDNGETWEQIPVLSNANKKLPASVTYVPPFYSSDGAIAVEMDKNGIIHMAFGKGGGYMDGGTSYIYVNVNGLIYWNTTMPMVQDSLDLDSLEAHGNLLGYVFNGPNPGDTIIAAPSYRVGLSSHPQIAIDDYNNIYVLYSAATPGNPSPDPYNYRHMWTRAKFYGKDTWTDMLDLNEGVFYMFYEFAFPNMAKQILNNNLNVIYQTSTQPGSAVQVTTIPVHDNSYEHRVIPLSTYGAVLTVNPPNRTVPTAAGNTLFTVYSTAAWTATDNAAWLTVTASGSGPGPLTATFTENTTGAQRVANITVNMAGVSPVIVTVTQEGPATGYILNGTITYPNTSSTPLSAVSINLKNSSGTVIGTTTTNASGLYTFTNVANGSYTFEPSTAKAWGGVTASDVLLYKKHIGNIAFLQGIFLASGDVNASGGLSAADVLLVKKRIGSLINSFVVGNWLFNNTAVTVNGGNVTQNFNGLTYGDANGSYTPPAQGAPIVSKKKSLTGALTIETVTHVIAGPVSVPVQASQIVNMGSFQFTIEYDTSLMTYTGTSNWYPGITSVSIGEPTPGHLTFVWAADAAGINISDDTFFNIDFTWTDSSSTSLIIWSDNPTAREFGDWDGNIFEPSYTNGSVTGAPVGVANNERQYIKVYPNPASEYVELKSDYTIQNIEVMSYLGQVVYSTQDVETKTVRINVSGFQSGIYFVKVKTNQGSKVVKATVTH